MLQKPCLLPLKMDVGTPYLSEVLNNGQNGQGEKNVVWQGLFNVLSKASVALLYMVYGGDQEKKKTNI